MATNLTTDTNFVAQGDYRLAVFPISAIAPVVGSWAYLNNSGSLVPVSGSTSSTQLVIGQVVALGTAILASENKAVVRYNGAFEANFDGASTGFVAGTEVYLDSDNTIVTASLSGSYPPAGIYLGLSPNGNAMVKHSIDL